MCTQKWMELLTLGKGSSVTNEPGSATGQAVVFTRMCDCERQCFQRGSHHRPTAKFEGKYEIRNVKIHIRLSLSSLQIESLEVGLVQYMWYEIATTLHRPASVCLVIAWNMTMNET